MAVLSWLNANKVDYVVVGAVARAIRGDRETRGPVAIVPAPYGRNWERLCAALVAGHAGLRTEVGAPGRDPDHPGAGQADGREARPRPPLAAALRRSRSRYRGRRARTVTMPARGSEDVGPRYQELLYESGRFEIAEGLSVEVASPEDLELFSHVRRTGAAPEFRVTPQGRRPSSPRRPDPAVAIRRSERSGAPLGPQ